MKTAKGFTLLELLITILIFMTLVWVSASLPFLKSKNEAELFIVDIKAALHYAKIQALVLGYPLYLIPLNDSNWSLGIKCIGTDTKTLQEWKWNYPSWELSWLGGFSSNKLILSPSPLNAMSNGTFTLVNKTTKEQYKIVLNRIGRIKVKVMAGKDQVT